MGISNFACGERIMKQGEPLASTWIVLNGKVDSWQQADFFNEYQRNDGCLNGVWCIVSGHCTTLLESVKVFNKQMPAESTSFVSENRRALCAKVDPLTSKVYSWYTRAKQTMVCDLDDIRCYPEVMEEAMDLYGSISKVYALSTSVRQEAMLLRADVGSEEQKSSDAVLCAVRGLRDAVEALKNVLAAALDSKSLEAESLAA